MSAAASTISAGIPRSPVKRLTFTPSRMPIPFIEIGSIETVMVMVMNTVMVATSTGTPTAWK